MLKQEFGLFLGSGQLYMNREIRSPGRSGASCQEIHKALQAMPIATVNKGLGHLIRLGLVRELTSQKRNRLFSYFGYLEIMNQGTELPER